MLFNLLFNLFTIGSIFNTYKVSMEDWHCCCGTTSRDANTWCKCSWVPGRSCTFIFVTQRKAAWQHGEDSPVLPTAPPAEQTGWLSRSCWAITEPCWQKPFEKAEPRGWVPWLNERRQCIPASAFHPVEGARRDSPTPKPYTWEAVQTQNFQKKGLIS